MERHQRLGEAQTLLEMRFAFLRLGTGNAMAGVVGQNPLEDVRRLIDYVPSRTYKLPLLRAGNNSASLREPAMTLSSSTITTG